MKKILIVASTMFLLLAVAPLSARAEDDKSDKSDDIASACKTITRLVKVYPQFNLTVPPACKAWEDGSVTKQCTELKANLRVGDRGERVLILHQMLVQAGYGPFANDEFDEQTAAAVVGFQEQYRSEVLAPYSLVRGTGFVGVSTRAKLNALFGCVVTIPPSQSVSLRIISAPSSLTVNEEGTWKLGITTGSSTSYTVSVTWGDEAVPTTGTAASVAEKSVANTTTFTHSYAATGSYWVTFRLTSGGQSRTVTRRVEVKTGDTTEQKITAISPNGGESWQVGETRTVSWKASQKGQVALWIERVRTSTCPIGTACTLSAPAPLQIARLDSHEGVNSYNWRIGTQYGTSERETVEQYKLTSGNYVMRICSTGNAYCDQSDGAFTLTVTPTANREPSITSVSGPTSLEVGKTGTWKIRVYDPDGDNLTYSILWGDDIARDTQLVSEIRAASATQATSFTHSYAAAGTYTVKITVVDVHGASALSTITVVVQ